MKTTRTTDMTSNKPYFIRALYDWIVDNNLTPYVLVNAEYPGTSVPQEHVDGGRIVLNISPEACRGLHIKNSEVLFTARFSGVTTQIFVPTAAVLAIYARENGRGMEFGEEDNDGIPPPSPPSNPVDSDKKVRHNKPGLKLVK